MYKNHSDMTRLAILLSLSIIVLLTAFHYQSFAQGTFSPAKPGKPFKLYKESSKDIIARMKWFYDRRVDAEGNIPLNERIEAWEQSKTMKAYQPTVLLKSGQTVESKWTLVGPRNRGGRITGIAVHPSDADIVYIAAANGGVWKSTNKGTLFTPVTEDLPTMSMGAVAIDPSNPDIVWAGTGEANGESYIYPGIGVIKSTDAGATWNLTGLKSNTRIAALRIHPTIGDIAVAATWDGIRRTEDGGETWNTVQSGEVYDLAIHPADPSIWYAGIRSMGMFRSTDTGRTWTSLSTDWQAKHSVNVSSIRRIAFDMSRSTPGLMYAVLVKNNTFDLLEVMKSTDGGDSWNVLTKPSTDFFSGQGFYNCDMAVDPSDGNRVFIGGLYIYMTENGGGSWKRTNPSHVDQHALEFAPSDPNIFYAGHDGGFDISQNGGRSYTGLNDNLPISQYYDIDVAATNPDVILGGTQDNGSHLRKTNSPDWKYTTGGDGMYCVIDHTNANIMYTEMQYGQSRWRSTDGGNNWNGINQGIEANGTWVNPVVMHPDSTNILYTTSYYHLYKTTNRGDLWFKLAERVTNSEVIEKIAVSPANPKYMATGYSGTGGIAVSTDGGFTWKRVVKSYPRVTVTDIDYHPTDPNTIFATFTGYRSASVYKTTDNGETWTSISGNLPAIPKNTLALNPMNPDQMWVGTDLGVYTTVDGGAVWEFMGEGMPKVTVMDLHFHAASGLLRAATHGRSVYQILVTTPVDVATFSASLDGMSVRLSWRTTMETNNAGFAVERKDGVGERWNEIGYVPGNGSGAGVFSYSFTDSNLPAGAGNVVYRLKQLDFDGTYDYSKEAYVALGGAAPVSMELSQNYPNPFNPVTTIRYSIPEAGKVRLSVTDSRGFEVATLVDSFQYEGAYAVEFNAAALESGVYFFHLTMNGKRITKKMVALK